MPEPIPTPYDIADIPFFPSSPGTIAWIASCVAVALLWLLSRARTAPSSTNFPQLRGVVLKEFDRYGTLPFEEMKKSLGPLSLLVRRYLAALSGYAFDAASPREIEALLQDENYSRFREVGNLLLAVEQLRFSGESPSSQELMKLVSSLRREISTLDSPRAAPQPLKRSS